MQKVFFIGFIRLKPKGNKMKVFSLNSNLNFNGYIPVRYYEKENSEDKAARIVSQKNIKKCQGYIVRNLNGTSKDINQDFVKLYGAHDKDYKKYPHVRSYYPGNSPVAYLVTGYDADEMDKLAKPIGIAKGEAKHCTGNSRSYESRSAVRTFYKDAESFLKHSCNRVKSEDGEKYILNILVKPVYNKKNELKKFEFQEAKFTKETKAQSSQFI